MRRAEAWRILAAKAGEFWLVMMCFFASWTFVVCFVVASIDVFSFHAARWGRLFYLD